MACSFWGAARVSKGTFGLFEGERSAGFCGCRLLCAITARSGTRALVGLPGLCLECQVFRSSEASRRSCRSFRSSSLSHQSNFLGRLGLATYMIGLVVSGFHSARLAPAVVATFAAAVQRTVQFAIQFYRVQSLQGFD